MKLPAAALWVLFFFSKIHKLLFQKTACILIQFVWTKLSVPDDLSNLTVSAEHAADLLDQKSISGCSVQSNS